MVIPGCYVSPTCPRSSPPRAIDGTLPVRLHVRDGRFTTRPISGNVLEMVTLPVPTVERRAA